MSAPATPAVTQMDEALQRLDSIENKQAAQTDAINSLGANVQWIVDNVQGIFQMFNSPQFTSMLPGVMAGAASGIPEETK